MSDREKFVKEYWAAVRVEAEYTFNALRYTAEADHYEPDLFIDDVLMEIQRVKRREIDNMIQHNRLT